MSVANRQVAGNGHARVETGTPSTGTPSFEGWRTAFFSDAQARGLLQNAEMIGDVALRLFWQDGVSPTVEAILNRAGSAGR